MRVVCDFDILSKEVAISTLEVNRAGGGGGGGGGCMLKVSLASLPPYSLASDSCWCFGGGPTSKLPLKVACHVRRLADFHLPDPAVASMLEGIMPVP